MKKRWIPVALALTFLAGDAGAQDTGMAAACGEVHEGLQITCRVAAQAAQGAPAQVGILLAGGNPTVGTASGGGLRLGRLPGVSVSLTGRFVHLRIPDLREVRISPTDAVSYGELSVVAPSLAGSASVALFPGFSAAPTVGGIGAIDLLGSASWLPLTLIGSDEFRSGSADLAWGAGVRVGVVRESFTLPGASISVMRHRLGTVRYGRMCPNRAATGTSSGPGYRLEQGVCTLDPSAVGQNGDLGEFALDVDGWSTRAAVSKHLLGLGLSAGLGYDRFSSDVEAGVREPETGFTAPGTDYARVTDVEISDGRLSAFLNGSYSLLFATFAAELGWMQGGEAVAGYPDSTSDFDPGDGTLFGSLGLRVAL